MCQRTLVNLREGIRERWVKPALLIRPTEACKSIWQRTAADWLLHINSGGIAESLGVISPPSRLYSCE
jgi:hypothetical protein